MRRLDELARTHPEAFEKMSARQWERTLRETEMAAKKRGRPPSDKGETRARAFRLDDELIARVDAFAERMQGKLPGARFTRADALRVLLDRALCAEKL